MPRPHGEHDREPVATEERDGVGTHDDVVGSVSQYTRRLVLIARAHDTLGAR